MVIMISIREMQIEIAKQSRSLRLEQNLSQMSLAEKSGVSYGSIKKFEHTGQISLESLLKLSLVLGCIDNFKKLFLSKTFESPLTLDELINHKKRERGRK
jgi:transcriptional regulator with XRE-family HTH domain